MCGRTVSWHRGSTSLAVGQGAAGYLGAMESKPPTPPLPAGLQAAWHRLPTVCPSRYPGDTIPCFLHLAGLVVGVCLAWPMLPATSTELNSRERGSICQMNRNLEEEHDAAAPSTTNSNVPATRALTSTQGPLATLALAAASDLS